MKTLYLFVSCCMEESRYGVAKQVLSTLRKQREKFEIDGDLIAFDNGSTHPGSLDLLTNEFTMVFSSPTNNGYWSAIKWCLDNYKDILKQEYEYVHVIESDHTYYALDKLNDCQEHLDSNPNVGAIRLQEYVVGDSRYDKTLHRHDGLRYAWVSHVNQVTREKISCIPVACYHRSFYRSNFLTCLHSLNRLSTIKNVFDELARLERFSENDFQRMYHDSYKIIDVLDRGIFHAKLGFTLDDPSIVSGSWTDDPGSVGYKKTREDRIVPYQEVKGING